MEFFATFAGEFMTSMIRSLKKKMVTQFHCNNIGTHCGVEKTHTMVVCRLHWPGEEALLDKSVSYFDM